MGRGRLYLRLTFSETKRMLVNIADMDGMGASWGPSSTAFHSSLCTRYYQQYPIAFIETNKRWNPLGAQQSLFSAGVIKLPRLGESSNHKCNGHSERFAHNAVFGLEIPRLNLPFVKKNCLFTEKKTYQKAETLHI